jgi:hypothetical protein
MQVSIRHIKVKSMCQSSRQYPCLSVYRGDYERYIESRETVVCDVDYARSVCCGNLWGYGVVVWNEIQESGKGS